VTLAEINRRFTTAEQLVELPGLTVRLLKPRNSDDLISEADYVRDERLPYWADLWASAEVLATYLVERVETFAPARGRALELGCGLGLVSIAAASVGFEVLATDYYDDALLFVEENARRSIGQSIATRMVDWTKLPDDLGTFELVFAADVLYEMRYADVVADAVARTLAPGGVFILADQGRIALQAFLDEASARGLVSKVTHRVDAPEGIAKPNISVYELRWKE
jgi:ETFB lysine methyltransferase